MCERANTQTQDLFDTPPRAIRLICITNSVLCWCHSSQSRFAATGWRTNRLQAEADAHERMLSANAELRAQNEALRANETRANEQAASWRADVEAMQQVLKQQTQLVAQQADRFERANAETRSQLTESLSIVKQQAASQATCATACADQAIGVKSMGAAFWMLANTADAAIQQVSLLNQQVSCKNSSANRIQSLLESKVINQLTGDSSAAPVYEPPPATAPAPRLFDADTIRSLAAQSGAFETPEVSQLAGQPSVLPTATAAMSNLPQPRVSHLANPTAPFANSNMSMPPLAADPLHATGSLPHPAVHSMQQPLPGQHPVASPQAQPSLHAQPPGQTAPMLYYPGLHPSLPEKR